MSVSGRFARKYNPNIWASLNLANNPYFFIDADGEYLSSQCWAHIYTSFRISPTAYGSNISACRAISTNTPSADAAVLHEVVGVVKGSGYVNRWAFGQPSYPAMQYCGAQPAPCVWALSGTQTITIEPTALKLSLDAIPDTVFVGDSVFFLPAAEGGLAYSVRAWIWVPDEVDPPVLATFNMAPTVTTREDGRSSQRIDSRSRVSSGKFGELMEAPGIAASSDPDPRTVYCPATAATCRIPIFQSGVMYVRAMVGSGSGQVLEQASARVTVQDPKLIAVCDKDPPNPKTRFVTQVLCEASLSINLPFRITERSSLADTMPIVDGPLNVLVQAGESDYWEGARAINTTQVVFTGNVTVVGNRTIPLTSNAASFVVTPRSWQAPSMPPVAPVDVVTKATSDSAELTKDPTVPGPFPGFILSSSVGLPDRATRGGVANINFGLGTYSVFEVSSGPNKGLRLLPAMPVINVGRVRVLESLYPGNQFFDRQTSASPLPGEPPVPAPYQTYCTAADLNDFRQTVLAHEGAATSAAPSHYSEGVKFLQNAAVKVETFFESLVYRGTMAPSLDSTVQKRWDALYGIPWKAASADSIDGGPVKPVAALNCKLRG